jgi:hypothetical protein
VVFFFEPVFVLKLVQVEPCFFSQPTFESQQVESVFNCSSKLVALKKDRPDFAFGCLLTLFRFGSAVLLLDDASKLQDLRLNKLTFCVFVKQFKNVHFIREAEAGFLDADAKKAWQQFEGILFDSQNFVREK